MWVRTQEKNDIIKCDNIYIDVDFVYDGICYKIRTSKNNKIYLLGIYSKREGAFKVLNEIQEKICNGENFYQMPFDYGGLKNE